MKITRKKKIIALIIAAVIIWVMLPYMFCDVL